MIQLADNLSAPIGSRFLKTHNQLVFVEYTKGAVSAVDLVRPQTGIASQGTIILKGTWLFDCETGTLSDTAASPADIWWEQMTTVNRRMTPTHGAQIVNLGSVDFAGLTPVALQGFSYGTTPIPGNNDATNQLVTGDVFAVLTKNGNFCKIKVLQYDYNMKVEWVTYKLASAYKTLGTGYTTPEDVAVRSDEKIAYVTERTGNLLRVDLTNANRAAATVVASGMQAPQQIWLDEAHNQAYIVEYANPGRLFRIDLASGTKTALINNLVNAVGLVVSKDLSFAYIGEQTAGGRISRYSLTTGNRVEIASGLTSPFFLTWVDENEAAIFVAERDPANRISIVDIAGGSRQFVSGLPFRPSSVAVVKPGQILVCCDKEIDIVDVLAGYTVAGLAMGVGFVPWDLITAAGKADTTTQSTYPYQFPKDSPFGGTLLLQINHALAWQGGVRYYRILVDGIPRLESWSDLKMNTANGKYEIPVQFSTETVHFPAPAGDIPGCYKIHAPGDWYYNSNLGMILNSTALSNGLRLFKIDFLNDAGVPLQSVSHQLLIDNNMCVASISMPTLDGHAADDQCGLLKYADKTHMVSIAYVATHPNNFAKFSLNIVKGAHGVYNTNGAVPPPPPSAVNKSVNDLIGTCTIAAFGVGLYVATTVINGNGRQSQYDASASIAFALAP